MFKKLKNGKNMSNTKSSKTIEWKPRTWVIPPGLHDLFRIFARKCRMINADRKRGKHRQLIIYGPTGVGKSMFVEYFICNYQTETACKTVKFINCAAIPETLLESELFGYVKGAATGATTDKIGYFEAVGEGIIVLEEIGELSKPLQAKLLIAIENRIFSRLGSTDSVPFKAQIIATTNVDRTAFRPDFWYRFDTISIPPIYARRCDIPYYIEMIEPDLLKVITKSTLLGLMCHNWPGNVREIEKSCDAVRESIFHQEEIFKTLEPEQEFDLTKHINFDQNRLWNNYDHSYGVAFEKIEKLSTRLRQNNIDIKKIDKALSPNLLSIGEDKLLAFKENYAIKKSSYIRGFENFQFRSNLLLDVYSSGLNVFCKLFFQDIHADYNLLDLSSLTKVLENRHPSSNFRGNFYPHFTVLDDTHQFDKLSVEQLEKIIRNFMAFSGDIYLTSWDEFNLWPETYKYALAETLKHFTGLNNLDISDVDNLYALYQRFPSNKFLRNYFGNNEEQVATEEISIKDIKLDDLKELYYETICNEIGMSHGFQQQLADIAGRTPGLISQNFKKFKTKFSDLNFKPRKRLVILK